MTHSKSDPDHGRRRFLGATVAAAGTLGLGGPFRSLAARHAHARTATCAGYGPLRLAMPERNGQQHLLGGAPLFMLPAGFRLAILSVTGQKMADGGRVPYAFDGMTAVRGAFGPRLVRNHEDRVRARDYASTSQALRDTERGPRAAAYDGNSGGGCTTVDLRIGWNGVPDVVAQHWSLVGTEVNCAGGRTPWDTWISCEEEVYGQGGDQLKPHGYCFEVSSTTMPGSPTFPQPLTGLGRFKHEAIAIDPGTGIAYQTEDAGSSDCGFYRWVPAPNMIPRAFGDLARFHAAGTLQMLKVVGSDVSAPLKDETTPGAKFTVEWVTIDQPNPAVAPEPNPTDSCGKQGRAKGGASFKKLEGCYFGNGKVYFVGSSGAGAGLGQVWSYDPYATENQLELLYVPTDYRTMEAPDNVFVTPRGGLLLCEDGDKTQFLRGLTPDGRVFDFARNVYNHSELAGACFARHRDGMDYLFVNIFGLNAPSPSKTPDDSGNPDVDESSVTVAIWGPWGAGLL